MLKIIIVSACVYIMMSFLHAVLCLFIRYLKLKKLMKPHLDEISRLTKNQKKRS